MKLPVTFSSRKKTKQAGGQHQSRLLSKSLVWMFAAATDSRFHTVRGGIKERQRRIRTLRQNFKGLFMDPVYAVS